MKSTCTVAKCLHSMESVGVSISSSLTITLPPSMAYPLTIVLIYILEVILECIISFLPNIVEFEISVQHAHVCS